MIVDEHRRQCVLSIQALIDMRNQLTICSASSAPARRPTTYAGLGLDRGLTVGLRSQLSAHDRLSSRPSPMSACGST